MFKCLESLAKPGICTEKNESCGLQMIQFIALIVAVVITPI